MCRNNPGSSREVYWGFKIDFVHKLLYVVFYLSGVVKVDFVRKVHGVLFQQRCQGRFCPQKETSKKPGAFRLSFLFVFLAEGNVSRRKQTACYLLHFCHVVLFRHDATAAAAAAAAAFLFFFPRPPVLRRLPGNLGRRPPSLGPLRHAGK